MEMSVFELLGVAGIAISMLAYVPQVVHLGREHCSAGISRRRWLRADRRAKRADT